MRLSCTAIDPILESAGMRAFSPRGAPGRSPSMKRLYAVVLALVVFALAAPPVRGDEVLEASRKAKAREAQKKKSGGKADKKRDGKVLSNTGLKKAGENAKFSQVG